MSAVAATHQFLHLPAQRHPGDGWLVGPIGWRRPGVTMVAALCGVVAAGGLARRLREQHQCYVVMSNGGGAGVCT